MIGPERAVALRRSLGVLLAAFGLAILMAVAGAAKSVSYASAKPGYTVFPGQRWQTFQVRASNGYTFFVRSIGRDRVSVEAISGQAHVSYIAPADVTGDSISANVPRLGRLAMSFHPSAPVLPSSEPQGDCRGRHALIQNGTFVGRFRWRGERGYTSASATKATGYRVHSFREVCKGEGAGVGDEGLIVPLLVARSRTPARFAEVQAYRREESEPPSFIAFMKETRFRLEISRLLMGGSGTIDIASSGVIKVAPRAPFSGIAEFQPERGAAGSWTGTLTAVFPGRGRISLAGPTFSAWRSSG